MGVYIKGMTAQQARMWLNYHMPFTFIITNEDITEVPEPHGDLIDKRELEALVEEKLEKFLSRLDLQCPPTVIEAEGEQ